MKKRLLLLLFLFLPGLAGAEEGVLGDVEFCLAKDSKWNSQTHLRHIDAIGVSCATVYYNLTSKDNRADPLGFVRRPYLDREYKVILALILSHQKEMKPELSLVEQITAGVFDQELDRLVAAIKEVGKPIIIRPLHEFDGSWNDYGMYNRKVGNTVEKTVAALKHVIVRLKKAGDLVQIDLNINRRDGRGRVLGDADRYMSELEPLADMFSISSYNRCGINGEAKNRHERSFQDDFGPTYTALLGYTKKPINVAETSTSGLCTEGEKLPWFERMFTDLKSTFPRTNMVTLYFGYKEIGEASNTVPVDWGLVPRDRPRFRELLHRYWPQRYQLPTESVWSDVSQASNWSAPWNFDVAVRNTFSQPENPALHPVTGQSFGTNDLVFMGMINQYLLYNITDNIAMGPMIQGCIFQSTNNNQWWNNAGCFGTGFGVYYVPPKTALTSYGKLSLELRFTQYEYTVSTPDNLRDGNDQRFTLQLRYNTGGDWLQ